MTRVRLAADRREYIRIEHLLRSAAAVGTTLPFHVVVGGDRNAH